MAPHVSMRLTFIVTLALPSLTYGEILHVRPASSNTSCPTYPCHTLSEYAEHHGEYFNTPNIALQFLQGNHTLNVNLDITNIQQLDILGDSSALIPTSIECSSHIGFTFRNISLVRIDSLAFSSCARSHQIRTTYGIPHPFETRYFGVYLEFVWMTEITNCTFQDSFGSALGVVASRHVSFKGSTTFSNNSATYYGGGVYADDSSVIFDGSTTFSNNSASRDGGGVYASSSSAIRFNGSTTFSNNSARWGGGGVYASSSSAMRFNGSTTFSSNSASVYGGGVYASSSSAMRFNGSTTFSNNSATYYGGGVYADDSSVIFDGSTTFSSNSASRDGGGVYASSSSAMRFNGSTTFSNNSATYYGGGVYADDSSVIFDGSTTFSSNSASVYGGGVYASSSSAMRFNGSTTFSNNSASRDGGGIYAISSSVMSFNGSTTFSNNSASVYGGGIYASSSSAMRFNGSTTFSNNSATYYGGGVFADDSSVFFDGSTTFSSNSASVYGGGVYASSSSAMRFNGSTTFSNNSASRDGGGVYASSSSDMSFNGSTTFSGNSANEIGGGVYASSSSAMRFNGSTTFSNNSASRDGGGIYAISSSVMSFNGSTTFSNNSASGYGGGVYASSSSAMRFNGSTTFSNNSATYYGGGVFADDSSVIFDGSTTFSNNSASGGVYADDSSVIFDGSTTFSSNSASVYGGGVYASSSSAMRFNGSTTFSNNSATYFGGGVYADDSSVIFDGSTTFSSNSASVYGGGVYASSSSAMRFNGSTTFSNNSASRDGGGVYASSSSAMRFNGSTTFSNNSASRDGGGVYASSSSAMSFNGSTTFSNNSAENGGGIYAISSSVMSFNGSTTFSNNSAENGGGIFAISSSAMSFNGSTTFSNNSASTNGGGVSALQDSVMSFNGSTTFSNNSASGGGGGGVSAYYRSVISFNGSTTFSNNSARYGGGGVYAGISSVMSFNGSTTFSNSASVDGGGVNALYSSVSFNGSTTFSGNSASGDGGGVYASASEVSFRGTNVIVANIAARFGGGIYTQASTNLPASGIYLHNQLYFSGTCVLSENTAQLDGGGIYTDGGNLNLSGSIAITNNTAGLGGGIYSDNSTLTIYGCNVEGNIAAYNGGGLYVRRSLLALAGNNMFNANSAREGGGIFATVNTTLDFDGENSFTGNRAHISGGGIWLFNSNLSMKGNNCFVKCTAAYEGGGIFSYASNATLPGNNTFVSNSATTGGGIHARWSNVGIASISNTAFRFNTAVFGAGIFTDNSTFEFSGASNITNNHASHTGGGMYAARSILNFLATSSVTIIANDAVRDGGGMYTRDGCVVKLHGFNSYENNSAEDTGGGISAFRSSFIFSGNNTFTDNKAVTGGGFYASNSTVIFPGKNNFIANSAISHGGGVAATRSTLHLNGLATVKNNSALSGGGFYIAHSTMKVDGLNYFVNNTANSAEGGAICFSDSQVEFKGRSIFSANTAGTKGAAIHTSFTTLIFEGTSSFVNNSANYGGGVQSESSNITFVNLETNHHMNMSQSCINYENCCDKANFTSDFGSSFLNNRADRGGALYLDQYSNFSLHLTTCLHFQGNQATEFGGALYVVDATGPGQFLPQQYTPSRSECFFYILGKEQPPYLDTTPLVFKNNFAGMRGSALYGGLLGKCNLTSMKYSSALDFFRRSVVQKDNDSFISSDPTRICFCSRNGQNCTETIQSKSIYPGQNIEVSVIAVDQSDVAIPTLIHVNVRSGEDHNVTEIITYETERRCTSRNYSTPLLFNQLELYPNNRSGSTVQLTVNIIFENCPIGFEESNFSGECICDHRLWKFTNTCDIDTQSILRPGGTNRSFWLGVALNNGTPEGFIHHRYCPLDYCIREDKHINLKHPDDQCSFNRSGLLCGQCRRGLSLMLGSSQCKKCTNTFLALLIPFALAGVLLVTLLFLLHLTVAEGTLHGLIFYANIVEANHHIFFPQSSISTKPASIFIAWLNLDLGIEICFYEGMDGYATAWLEYVFPVYIWGIMGFLVYISNRSTRFTKLLGSSPVPVLATLFFLSYAKLLRTIIAVLSLTTLYYPYHTENIVWVRDANIPMTKYIPLVLVVVLFLLLLFLPYTLLLLVGQWLQPKSYLCFLSWVRNPKVKAILDSYHAPYKLKHRYWTGLLLLLRCALYLVFAFNVTGDDSINLLIISSTVLGTSVIFGLVGMVYKSWYLNALELSFILNLGILAAATHHVNQSGGSQAAVAYTSVGIAFLAFVGIVSYHIFCRIKSKMQCIQSGRQLRPRNNHQIDANELQGCQPAVTPTITHTVVDLQELRSPLDLLDTK